MKNFKQLYIESKKPCWKGYEQIGTKEKNGKEVPNCVPINETHLNDEIREVWELFSKLGDKIAELEKSYESEYEKQPHPELALENYNFSEDEELTLEGAVTCPYDDEKLEEAEYQGRKVTLNKPMQGDSKKFKVYVKDPKTGNVKKVNFGAKGYTIKKSNPTARKSFRARHNCDNPGPKTKAKYWSCRMWESQLTESIDISTQDVLQADAKGGPEIGEQPIVSISEKYSNKIKALHNKRAKLEEELKDIDGQIQQQTQLAEKKRLYDEAKTKITQLKEEIDEIKNKKTPEKIVGGKADGMTNQDIADNTGAEKDVIDQQVEMGTDVEAEHTDDPEEAKEIAQDHTKETADVNPEDPDYYGELQDMEDEIKSGEKEEEQIDEGKKKKDKAGHKDGKVISIDKATGTKSGKDPIGNPGKTHMPSKRDITKFGKGRRREGKKELKKELKNIQTELKESWNKMNKNTGSKSFNLG